MMRIRKGILVLGLLAATLFPAVARCDTEDGGTGISRIEQAFSLPIGRPLFNLSTGYFSQTPDSIDSKYLTITPSITLGLGMGFEASFGLPLDGLTTTEGLPDYERRFDIRTTEATAKLRYTGNLGTPRVRFGILGLVDLPISGAKRPGGTKEPDQSYDPGIMGLLSFNFGPDNVPLRLHGNFGYWQSRNDGAIYFRDYPGALTVPGLDPDKNDTYFGGLAFEAGFPGATAFAELTAEYLADGGDFMSPEEGYWRFTPGVKFKLSQTIAMTAAVSADVSKDDSKTLFKPGDVYPETEFQLAISLGRVFGQAGYEMSLREKEEAKKKQEEELAAALAAAKADSIALAEARADSAAAARAAAAKTGAPHDTTVVKTTSPTPYTYYNGTQAPAYAYPEGSQEMRFMELENRLRFLELDLRMREIEDHLRYYNNPPPGYYRAYPDTTRSSDHGENVRQSNGKAAAPAAADTATMASHTAKTEQERQAEANNAALIAAQQREIDRLRADMDRNNGNQRQVNTSGGNESDDSHEGAALAAGMVAGAAVANSNDKESAPPANTAAPAAAGAAAGAAVGTTAAAGDTGAVPAAAGTRSVLVPLKTDGTPLLNDPDTRAALDRLAAALKANPNAEVLLLVHGSGTDRDASLKATEDQAGLIRDYLALAGCNEAQYKVLAMGNAEPPVSGPAARIEVARTR